MHYYGEWQYWFDPIIPAMRRFGEYHGMRVMEFYRDQPRWSFEFALPQGGNGLILLIMESARECEIVGLWNLIDYDVSERRIHDSARLVSLPADEAVSTALSAMLEIICNWKVDELKLLPDPFRFAGEERMTKQEIDHLLFNPPLLNPPIKKIH